MGNHPLPHSGVIKRIIFWGEACLSQTVGQQQIELIPNQAGRSRVFNYRMNKYSRQLTATELPIHSQVYFTKREATLHQQKLANWRPFEVLHPYLALNHKQPLGFADNSGLSFKISSEIPYIKNAAFDKPPNVRAASHQ